MEYGSGIKLGTAFEHDKERIKHALNMFFVPICMKIRK